MTFPKFLRPPFLNFSFLFLDFHYFLLFFSKIDWTIKSYVFMKEMAHSISDLIFSYQTIFFLPLLLPHFHMWKKYFCVLFVSTYLEKTMAKKIVDNKKCITVNVTKRHSINFYMFNITWQTFYFFCFFLLFLFKNVCGTFNECARMYEEWGRDENKKNSL